MENKRFTGLTEGLSERLKSEAVKLGLCKEWTEGWGYPNQQGLIDKFLHGIDFCIKHDWPKADFIASSFDRDLLHRNHIYVNEDVQLRNATGTVVVNGTCGGMALFDGLATCDLYVRNGSRLTVDCGGLSKVFVNVYDQAAVSVIQSDCANVYVYLHGDGCRAETRGDVKVRKSEK